MIIFYFSLVFIRLNRLEVRPTSVYQQINVAHNYYYYFVYFYSRDPRDPRKLKARIIYHVNLQIISWNNEQNGTMVNFQLLRKK
jgi:hypothetical protein